MIASVLGVFTNALLTFRHVQLVVGARMPEALVDEVQRAILHLLEDLAEVEPGDSDRADDEAADQENQHGQARPAGLGRPYEVLHDAIARDDEAARGDR